MAASGSNRPFPESSKTRPPQIGFVGNIYRKPMGFTWLNMVEPPNLLGFPADFCSILGSIRKPLRQLPMAASTAMAAKG